MKKTYIIPQVNTVRLQAEKMLASSTSIGGSLDDNDMGILYGGVDDGSHDADAKGNFFGESIFD